MMAEAAKKAGSEIWCCCHVYIIIVASHEDALRMTFAGARWTAMLSLMIWKSGPGEV